MRKKFLKVLVAVMTLMLFILLFGCTEEIYHQRYQYYERALIKEESNAKVLSPVVVEVRQYLVVLYTSDSIYTYFVVDKRNNVFITKCNIYPLSTSYVKFNKHTCIIQCLNHGYKVYCEK